MILGTALGVVIGVLATVVVGHYYFRRTVNKSLGVYGLLNSYVFAGIAPDVRRELHFLFQTREVEDLQQLIMLVANDGEKSIRDVIEPPTLRIPNTVEVLDASILYKSPGELSVQLAHDTDAEGSTIALKFPLLNKKEFFVVKLLISGRLPIADICFSVLADDLPRSLPVKPIPPMAVAGKQHRPDWALITLSAVTVSLAGWIIWLLTVVHDHAPSLFPYPWATFDLSISSVLTVVPAVIITGFLALIAVGAVGAAFFGGQFPPARSRFVLPEELRDSVFPYRVADAAHSPSGWRDADWGDKAEAFPPAKSDAVG